MKTNLEFAALHGPVFISHDNGGTNFGEKLYCDKRNKGQFDEFYLEEREGYSDRIVVKFKGKTSYIQNWQNVVLLENQAKQIIAAVPIHHANVKAQVSGPGAGLKFTAQVETPNDKVQGKPGGRKAKYQGEESQGE
jgi:hypothetical protein